MLSTRRPARTGQKVRYHGARSVLEPVEAVRMNTASIRKQPALGRKQKVIYETLALQPFTPGPGRSAGARNGRRARLIRETARQQIDRVTQTFLPMKKLIIADLEKAYEGD